MAPNRKKTWRAGRLAALMTLGAMALPAAANAATVFVNCPVASAKHQVVTPLPGGWWNTPIVSGLSGTQVVTIAGNKALQCIYGASGRIQSNAPAGMNCVAEPTRFKCTSLLIPLPPLVVIHSSGNINIPQTFTANLDNGAVGGGGSDIWFQAVTATQLFITPQGSAKMNVGGFAPRGKAGCTGIPYSAASVPINGGLLGRYICVRTGAGRTAEFRVNQLTAPPHVLRISYTTWQ